MSRRVRLAVVGLLGSVVLASGFACSRRASEVPAASQPRITTRRLQVRTAAAGPVAGPAVTATHDASARADVEPTAPHSPQADATSEAKSDPQAGCLATVDELPASSGVDPHDRRLRRKGLLVAVKSSRRLMLFSDGRLEACWRIGLGFSPVGDKEVEGDGRTPEGWYATSDKPWSTFDDAIAIHYPNAEDADAAWRDGKISRRLRDQIREATARRDVPPQHTAMGGAVLIHGGGSSSDWTLGCMALEAGDLTDLRSRLPRRMKTDLLVLP